MANPEEFFKSIFPDLKEYKEQQREYFNFISFVCSFGKVLLAISKDNHIFDQFFLNTDYVFSIERELKINVLNPSFVEYQKTQKGDENIGEI